MGGDARLASRSLYSGDHHQGRSYPSLPGTRISSCRYSDSRGVRRVLFLSSLQKLYHSIPIFGVNVLMLCYALITLLCCLTAYSDATVDDVMIAS